MKLFLDVGAHEGETVRGVVSPLFRFDEIVCFEPSPQCWPRLERIRDPRVKVVPFGLAGRTEERELFDPGSIGASVFGDRPRTGAVFVARFVGASDWFREHVGPGDAVFVKLNCEGSECDILEDLLTSGRIVQAASIFVDFDVRKFPSQRHREAEIKQALNRAGIRTVVDAGEVAGPTRIAQIQRWLVEGGAAEPGALRGRERVRVAWDRHRFSTAPAAMRSLGLPSLGRRVLPAGLYRRVRGRLLGYPAAEKRPPASSS